MKNIKSRFDQASTITPSFPNWNKSFVSGLNSPLFNVENRIAENPVELISQVSFKPLAEGPPGHVHGGASAALIDEVMGVLVWNQNFPVVTQKLEVRYLKPLPLDEVVYLVSHIDHRTEQKITVKTTVHGNKKTPCIEATGVFHILSPETLKSMVTRLPE